MQPLHILKPALALLLVLLPAACTRPPASAYVDSTSHASTPVSVGDNTVGEACTQQSDSAGGSQVGADIFCGTWIQPSAHVRAGEAAGVNDLRVLATSGAWRAGLDTRFTCGEPTSTTILGANPALLLQCTRRIGGWPQVALVALVDGRAWYADGVLPVLPVMERAIGVLSGHIQAGAAPPSSAADALLAERLAARAFGSSDVGQYDQLIEAGTRANLADDPVRAEGAFRQALALQEKALGRDNPNIADPLSLLALQLSNQGRFIEADQLFQRAEPLAARSADPIAVARLLHHRALHAINQNRPTEALALLDQADAAYMREVPADTLRPKANLLASRGARLGASSLADLLPARELLTDPVSRAALLGLIEVRRYRGVVLGQLGRGAESAEALRSSAALARGNGLAQKLLSARLIRSGAMAAAAGGQLAASINALEQSTGEFSSALPDSKPLADTRLLAARLLAKSDRDPDAIIECRAAMRVLIALKAGTEPDLISTCLDVFARQAEATPAQSQTLLAEMFTIAQLAQGGITSQQIAQASARLSENARDPHVATAIRARQDASLALADLFRRKDELLQSPDQSRAAELDGKITEAQTALADADAALQAAAPNYGQLVQQVVSASAVQASLHPGEAFVGMSLNGQGGFVFLVRPDRLAVSRVAGGLPRIAELVHNIRASIESVGEATGHAPLPRFDAASAHDLYRITLQGVADSLDGISSLAIAPAGPLLALPMEVLLTDAPTSDDLVHAPWLLRRFTLTHVPSPSNFVTLRKLAAGATGAHPWFGFGDFHPITLAQAQRSFPGQACAESATELSELPALPFARNELEAARLLLGAQTTDERLGPDFTAAAVGKAGLKDFRILQFATHALLPAELRCQAEPAIVTSAPPGALDASGALLTASQIATLDLDADLIILSACNSGGPGGSTAGESLSGLARSFFYAGARALLVTHWAVNDQTAAYLVVDTLRRLRDNPKAGIATALREAELGMLDAAGGDFNAAVAHPFYWAPFALIGDGAGHG